jgi:hypothetical protein
MDVEFWPVNPLYAYISSKSPLQLKGKTFSLFQSDPPHRKLLPLLAIKKNRPRISPEAVLLTRLDDFASLPSGKLSEDNP